MVLQVEEVIMGSAGQFVPASAYPSMEGATGRDLIALAGSPTLAPQVRSWPLQAQCPPAFSTHKVQASRTRHASIRSRTDGT